MKKLAFILLVFIYLFTGWLFINSFTVHRCPIFQHQASQSNFWYDYKDGTFNSYNKDFYEIKEKNK